LTERTSLLLCSFQGSHRRTGTSAVRAGRVNGGQRAESGQVWPRGRQTGSLKTEQDEAAHARRTEQKRERQWST
jgi:hypothetical protein